jgi:hypothetical protein
MHSNHNIEEFRAPFTEESLKGSDDWTNAICAVQMAGLSECLAASQGLVETLISFSDERLLALPMPFCKFLPRKHCKQLCLHVNFHILRLSRRLTVVTVIRTAFAMVILIKLDVMVKHPLSNLGKIINREDLRIEEFFESLKARLKSVAPTGMGPTTKITQILSHLHEWYTANKDTKYPQANIEGNKPGQTIQAGVRPASPAGRNVNHPTSLDVLSSAAASRELTNNAMENPPPSTDYDGRSQAYSTQAQPITTNAHSSWYDPTYPGASTSLPQNQGQQLTEYDRGFSSGGYFPTFGFPLFNFMEGDLSGIFLGNTAFSLGADVDAEPYQGWAGAAPNPS